MKKGLLLAAAALCLAGCQNGIEKEYTMDVQAAYVATMTSEVQDLTHDVYVVHCKRGMSLFNYYIEVPEYPNVLPEHLVASDTGKTITYHIDIDGKDTKVSNHGYEFVKWGSK